MALCRVIAQGVLARHASGQMHVEVRARQKPGNGVPSTLTSSNAQMSTAPIALRATRTFSFHAIMLTPLICLHGIQVPLPTEASRNLLFLWTGGVRNPQECFGRA